MKKIIIIIIVITLIITVYRFSNLEETLLKTIYPLKYEEFVEKYSKKYYLYIYYMYAMIRAESNFDKNANSNSDAIGLMQILEDTAFEVAEEIGLENITEKDLYDPEININIGIKYFSNLLKQFDENYALAAIAYNAGIGNVKKWIETGIIKEDGSDLENVPFKETNNYVRKISNNYKIYKKIYE